MINVLKKNQNSIVVLGIFCTALLLFGNYSCGEITSGNFHPNFERGKGVMISETSPNPDNYSYKDIVQYYRTKYRGDTVPYQGRVIGKPGDQIEFQDGKLIRNGIPVKEEYISQNFSLTTEEIIVPKHTLYVLLDKRKIEGTRIPGDSRRFGPIPLSLVEGTVHNYPFF